jgi:hypothetical protein
VHELGLGLIPGISKRGIERGERWMHISFGAQLPAASGEKVMSTNAHNSRLHLLGYRVRGCNTVSLNCGKRYGTDSFGKLTDGIRSTACVIKFDVANGRTELEWGVVFIQVSKTSQWVRKNGIDRP